MDMKNKQDAQLSFINFTRFHFHSLTWLCTKKLYIQLIIEGCYTNNNFFL